METTYSNIQNLGTNNNTPQLALFSFTIPILVLQENLTTLFAWIWV